MQQSDVYYQLLSQHVSGIIMPIFRRTKTVCYCMRCTALVLLDVVGSGFGALRCRMRAQWRLQIMPYAVTHGLCSPEDGHNDARNMLRQKLITNIWLLHLVGFLSLHALLTMHDHRNLKAPNVKTVASISLHSSRISQEESGFDPQAPQYGAQNESVLI